MSQVVLEKIYIRNKDFIKKWKPTNKLQHTQEAKKKEKKNFGPQQENKQGLLTMRPYKVVLDQDGNNGSNSKYVKLIY